MQLLRARRPILAIAATGALAAFASGAQATPLSNGWPNPTLPQTLAVYDMSRPEYAPLGVPLGSFLFFPTASEAAAYDDNIFASDRRVASDLVNTTEEGMAIQSQWSQHSLSGQFFTAQQVYGGHSTEDADTYSGTVSGRYDISGEAFVEFDGHISQQPQSRAAAEALSSNGGERPVYDDYLPQVTYEQQFGPWNERAQGGFEKRSFTTSDALTFSYMEPTYRNRVTYDFTDRLGVFFDATFSQRQWNVSPEFRNSDSFTGLGGIAYQVPTVIDAELGIGGLRETFENSAFSNLNRPVLRGYITWNVLPLTTVLATANRTVTGTEFFCLPNATTCQTASGLTPVTGSTRVGSRNTMSATDATLGVQHEVYHNLLGGLQFNYARNVFDLDDLIDNTFEVVGSGRYLVNQNFELDFDYTHRLRSANQPFNFTFNSGPFNENILMLTLKAGL